MKCRLLIIIITLGLSSMLKAQKNEYQYIGVRFGASHGFSGAPAMNTNKYLNVPPFNDEMVLLPVSSYKGYTPGFVFDILYHFDFTTDNAGVVAGLEYNYNGISAKYNTEQGGYSMKETFRMNTIGVPVFFKYGPDIWDTQRYFYAGFQFNYIISMQSVQDYSWGTTPSAEKVDPNAYNKTSFGLFAGFNYLAFNIQLDFNPKSVFNKDYRNPDGYLINAGQVDQTITIKTCVNVPYGWLSDKSYWWKKKLRKFPLWK
ncbi:MAG: outer membrane beta-barrel protein [Bacteroidales bacterium]